MKSTPLWTRVCKPHSRAQRMFTSSTGVQSDGLRLYIASAPNVSCTTTGLLSRLGTIVSMCRLCALVADDAHLQDFDLLPDNGARQLPASREETFQASFEVGMRTIRGAVAGSTNVGSRSSSLARSTRCQTLRGGDPAAEGDVFPFWACCSWLRFFRGGVQTRTGSDCFL